MRENRNEPELAMKMEQIQRWVCDEDGDVENEDNGGRCSITEKRKRD